MSDPTHADIQRDLGRMEAGLEALKSAMKQGFDDIKSELRDIKEDVEALKAAEAARSGAFKFGHWLMGALTTLGGGSLLAWLFHWK